VVSLTTSVFVRVPRTAFVFAFNGPTAYIRMFEFRHDPDELHRRLAYELAALWNNNNRCLRPVQRACRTAAVSLVVEVLVFALLASATIRRDDWPPDIAAAATSADPRHRGPGDHLWPSAVAYSRGDHASVVAVVASPLS
jgi:hypothetical protein